MVIDEFNFNVIFGFLFQDFEIRVKSIGIMATNGKRFVCNRDPRFDR